MDRKQAEKLIEELVWGVSAGAALASFLAYSNSGGASANDDHHLQRAAGIGDRMVGYFRSRFRTVYVHGSEPEKARPRSAVAFHDEVPTKRVKPVPPTGTPEDYEEFTIEGGPLEPPPGGRSPKR